MKPKKSVSYFPVTTSEQVLLLRVREPDLAGRTEDLLKVLELVAESGLKPEDLEQAVQLLADSRQGEAIDARFENLEARLKDRIDRALVEIEGRLSQRLTGSVPPVTTVPQPSPATTALPIAKPISEEIPAKASLAFRVQGELIWGETAAQFYVAVWRWLFLHHKVTAEALPIQGGKKRYVAAAGPVHPSGNAFTRSEEPVPGVYIEVNLSRNDIIRRAKKYLEQFGAAYEVVVGSD